MGRQSVAVRKLALTSRERSRYTLQCVSFGGGYLAKVPAKKALEDFGIKTMTGAERFWYPAMLGGRYLTRVPVAEALSELPQDSLGMCPLGQLAVAGSEPAPQPAVRSDLPELTPAF